MILLLVLFDSFTGVATTHGTGRGGQGAPIAAAEHVPKQTARHRADHRTGNLVLIFCRHGMAHHHVAAFLLGSAGILPDRHNANDLRVSNSNRACVAGRDRRVAAGGSSYTGRARGCLMIAAG